MEKEKIRSIITAIAFVIVFSLTFVIVFMSTNKKEEKPKETETTQGESHKDEPKEDIKPYDYDLSEYVALSVLSDVKYSSDKIEEFVNKSVRNIAMQYAKFSEISRTTVQDGDTVIADYVGTLDGVEFSGGSAKDQEITIGFGMYIAGFEEGLIGHSIGETVELNLKFPDPYSSAPDLSGKDVVFKVTIKKLGIKELPEVTDDMIKSLQSGLFDTLDEYKEYMRELYTEEFVWEEYFSSCEIKSYPEDELDNIMQQMLDYYKSMASDYYNTTLENLVKISGFKSLDHFKEELLKDIKQEVSHEMVAYHTIRANDIEITDEEYTQIALIYAEKQGYKTVNELTEAIGKNAVEYEVYRYKIVSLIIDANKAA